MTQRTLVIKHDGKEFVSGKFNFGVARVMDDERYKYTKANPDTNLSELDEYQFTKVLQDWALEGLKKMYEGTTLTEDAIMNDLHPATIKKALEKIIEWFFETDEDVKKP